MSGSMTIYGSYRVLVLGTEVIKSCSQRSGGTEVDGFDSGGAQGFWAAGLYAASPAVRKKISSTSL